jgi:TRAP-type C4-dicarboxylate transport system permease small subunit
MAAIVDGYFRGLRLLLAILLAGMVIMVFSNVVLRYAFDSGIAVSEELARWFFVWMVFLGAIIGLKEHAHLGIDTLVRRLGPTARKLCFLLSHALMIFCSALLVKGSYVQTLINWNVAAPATGLSVGLFYGIGMVFGVSAIVILGYEVARVIAGRASHGELIAVRDSEDH